MSGYLGVLLVLLAAGLYWLLKPGPGPATQQKARPGVEDQAALEAAEAELQAETAPDATPEEAEENSKDWGPGTPQKPL
jgi:hypothetical protein